MLYSHNHLYKHIIHIHLHVHAESWRRHNNDERHSSFRKIYLSLYLKGLCVRRSWRPNRTATYWPPLLWPSAFLSRSPGLLNRGFGPSLSGCWFSLPHLISNLSDPQLLNRGPGAHSAGCWLSLPHLVSNSSDPQLINWGPEGSLCWVLAFSTVSCLQLVWSPNWLIGGLRDSSAGCWLSLPYLFSNWSGLQTALSYIIVPRPPSSCGRHNSTHSSHPRSRL